MLAVAPIVLRNLGVERYGVWAVATAAVSMGSIIASGFGDANIQHVATERTTGSSNDLLRVVRSTMGIHLILGAAMAILSWAVAPYMAGRLTPAGTEQSSCLWCLRIAGIMTFSRAVESVCISTQRAFERYGAAVRISVLARLLSLVAAAVLSTVNHSVVTIMGATAVLTGIGLYGQLIALKHLLRADTIAPFFDPDATKALFKFGIFSWLLAVSGVLFTQADKLIGGASLGAAAIVAYALCSQLAQPIYGLTSSTLHFLFPYLSGQRVSASAGELRRTVLVAFGVNLSLVLVGTTALLLFGGRILQAWGGEAIARSGAPLLPLVAWGSALLGLNVTGTYAMLALGRVQTVTWLNLVAGATMLLLFWYQLPRYGMSGIADSRLVYGFITLLIYVPLVLLLRPQPHTAERSNVSTSVPAGEQA
jgi:O-antigen/teichoic acid export membrane protein